MEVVESVHVCAEDGASSSAAMQWVLGAYRAMEPVKDVIAHIKQHFSSEDEHWSSLEFQVLKVILFDTKGSIDLVASLSLSLLCSPAAHESFSVCLST